MPSNLLTELYAAYKDWCIFNRFSPESARRFYGSIWDVSSQSKRTKANGRRLFKARPVLDTGGIRLIPETPQTGA